MAYLLRGAHQLMNSLESQTNKTKQKIIWLWFTLSLAAGFMLFFKYVEHPMLTNYYNVAVEKYDLRLKEGLNNGKLYSELGNHKLPKR